MECSAYNNNLLEALHSVFVDVVSQYILELDVDLYDILEPSLEYPVSKACAAILLHIGRAFRPSFEVVFKYSFKLPCLDTKQFVTYAVSLIELFLRGPFPNLSMKYGSKIIYIRFLLGCAFLGELIFFCFSKKCYRHVSSLSISMMIVHDRWLQCSFRDCGGLKGLMEFCDYTLPQYQSLTCTTSGKVMGFHCQSLEVNEIFDRIFDCTKDYNRLQIVFSVKEKLLLAKQRVFSKRATDCIGCQSGCIVYLNALLYPMTITSEESSDYDSSFEL